MPRIFIHSFLFAAAFFLVLTGSASGQVRQTELLYRVCFPKEAAVPRQGEECKDEDCGLQEETAGQPDPTVEKSQRYTFLGATDLGELWGSDNYQVIGDGRVRFLLYVRPAVAVKTISPDRGYNVIPETVIQTAFFSSFHEYQGSTVSVTYQVRKETGQKREETGGNPLLQMVDLHCEAGKLKIYDNHTLYYRASEGRIGQRHCIELLWEKPQAPLRWQPASSLTVHLLTEAYCRKKQ